ncbi:TonB-dependent receptor [Pseudomaricurvus alkylphenolicus]|uniref:TonB-dependent receptor n=1 Tax=Pseudomaricurvus alkylphenolicus TaxID=1306991 RepID=UPI001421E75B|nr:TonB-dependent receptor [Pseudomaricurvus alkylphenolicus]NIB42163.1 TonB-dependent receptor [Pseudomaricurvus alkylphenolicus]
MKNILIIKHNIGPYALLMLVLLTVNGYAANQELRKSYQLPQQQLESALVNFAIQTNIDLIYHSNLVKDKLSNEVSGRYLLEEALAILLLNTGLGFESSNASVYLITELPFADSEYNSEATVPQEVIDEVLVTGYGLQNQYAIAHRRDSYSIAEFMFQDEMGKFPDFNIADSFRRLSGVGAIFDEDEGRFVVARGIRSEHNTVTIDGLPIATIDGFGEEGRSIGLEAIPSVAVKRLEATKTFSSDMDPGAIGSSLNLVTRSAFDNDGPFLTLDSSLSYHSYDDIPNDNSLGSSKDHPLGGNINILGSRLFGGDQHWGLSAVLTYNIKQRDESKTVQEGANYFDVNGQRVTGPESPEWNGQVSPNEYRWLIYTNRLERYGGHLKLEYFPSEDFFGYLSGYYFKQSQEETRNGHTLTDFEDLQEQSIARGRYGSALGRVTFDFFPLNQRNYGISLFSQWMLNQSSHLEVNMGYSFADFQDTDPSVIFETPRTTELGLDYDSSSFIATYQLDNPQYFVDPDNYSLKEYAFRQRQSEESIWALRLDLHNNIGIEGRGTGYKMGGEWRRLARQRDNTASIMTHPALTLSGLTTDVHFVPQNRSEPYLFIDFERLRQQQGFELMEAESQWQSALEDFDYQEDLISAYMMLTFSGDHYRMAAGARFEHVDVDTRNPVLNNGVIGQKSGDGKYANWLPSVSLFYEVSENTTLRAAYSRTLGRPAPGDAASPETTNLDGSINRADPDVNPSRVDNYDLTLDYHLDDGFMSIGVFHKDISDNIFRVPKLENGTVVIQPDNTTDSRLSGVELNIIKNRLDFLPRPLSGLGFSGNLTLMRGTLDYLDSSGTRRSLDRLIEQSERLANATLFYNWKNRFECRLIYAYQGEYTHVFFPDEPHLNREWLDYTQWDIHARYTLSNSISMYFEARNITDNDRVLAEAEAGLGAEIEFGRSFFLGLNLSM